MSSHIEDTAHALVSAITEFQRAHAQLHREVVGTQAAVSRAERRLRQAFGGMSPARWRALVSQRTSIRTAKDSRDAHLAKKRRLAVEAALADVSEAQASRQVRVERAQQALEEAAREVERFGPLATRLAGHDGHGPAASARYLTRGRP